LIDLKRCAGHCGACWLRLASGRARNLVDNRELGAGALIAPCVCIPLEPIELAR